MGKCLKKQTWRKQHLHYLCCFRNIWLWRVSTNGYPVAVSIIQLFHSHLWYSHEGSTEPLSSCHLDKGITTQAYELNMKPSRREDSLKHQKVICSCKIKRLIFVSMDLVDNLLVADLVQDLKPNCSLGNKTTNGWVALGHWNKLNSFIFNTGRFNFLASFYSQIYPQSTQIEVTIIVMAWKFPFFLVLFLLCHCFIPVQC